MEQNGAPQDSQQDLINEGRNHEENNMKKKAIIWKYLCTLSEQIFTTFINSNLSIFHLHYLVTMCGLMVMSIFVLLRNQVGTPMACTVDSSLKDVIDTYCWTIPAHIISHRNVNVHSTNDGGLHGLRDSLIFSHIAEGINPQIKMADKRDGPKVNYYRQNHQWMFMYLMLSAAIFWFPRSMLLQFQGDLLDIIEFKPQFRDKFLLDIQKRAMFYQKNLSTNISFVAFYIGCECFNFVIVIAQLFCIHYFVGNLFAIGIANLLQNSEERTDCLARTFPQFTTCVFTKPGPGGNTVEYFAQCVFANNSINQIIIILLWYWFCLLAALSVLAFVPHLLFIFSSSVRKSVIQTGIQSVDEIFSICNENYSDWFVLYYIKKHYNTVAYNEFLKALCSIVNKVE